MRQRKTKKVMTETGKRSLPASQNTFDETKIDVIRDAAWVYHNLGVGRGVDMNTAPSPGARAWLLHCQDNPSAATRFYDTYLAKLLRREAEKDEREAFQDDGRTVLAIIESLKAAGVSAK